MPRRKRATRRRRRRPRPRNSNRGGVIMSSLGSNPLPRKFKAQFRYVFSGQLDPPTAGGTANFIFRANDLYDPYQTGAGHQPSGFDELMKMYDHFCVIGSKVVVTFVNKDELNSQYVGISLRDSVSTEVNPQVILESGMYKTSVLGPSGSSKDTITLSYPCNPAKFLGRSHPLSDSQMKGSGASSPEEQCYYHIYGAALQTIDPGILDVQVTLDYTAILFEPKQVGLS